MAQGEVVAPRGDGQREAAQAVAGDGEDVAGVDVDAVDFHAVDRRDALCVDDGACHFPSAGCPAHSAEGVNVAFAEEVIGARIATIHHSGQD